MIHAAGILNAIAIFSGSALVITIILYPSAQWGQEGMTLLLLGGTLIVTAIALAVSALPESPRMP